MDTLRTFGDRVRWARLVAGIPQRELDRLAGHSEGFTGIIEARHSSVVQTDTVERYASALGIAASWLAFEEGPAPDEAGLRALGERTREAKAAAKAATRATRAAA